MMQLKLTDIKSKGIGIRTALKLAKTKYRDDWAVQEWLKIYEKGTNPVIINGTKSRKKRIIEGINPRSEFAKKGLIRAIELREGGKVMRNDLIKGRKEN